MSADQIDSVVLLTDDVEYHFHPSDVSVAHLVTLLKVRSTPCSQSKKQRILESVGFKQRTPSSCGLGE